MTQASPSTRPTIALDSECVSARVVLPVGLDPQSISAHLLATLARERGVEVTASAMEALASVVEAYRGTGGPVSEVFIRATPPEHGEAGFIEWMPGFDPDDPDAGQDAAGDAPVDFYAKRSFVNVATGDHVATIHEPTPGTDGRDVTGRTIDATPGRQVVLELDESLQRTSDGRVIAQLDGLLCHDGWKLWVDPVLDIKGGVDFSTGHIDFDGDVVIRRDIRDKFRVRATGDVTIEGLIDASHIDCGGSLHARRGVAGRDEGTLAVDGDAHLGYLAHVTGRVGGNLHVGREIIHSTITVGGDLVSELGRVIGGRLKVAGDARLADLGSGSDTPTELRFSAAPDDGTPAGVARAEIQKIHGKIRQLESERDAVRASAGSNDPAAAARQEQLTDEIDEFRARIDSLVREHPEAAADDASCGSTLEVLRHINGRVTLRFGSHTVVFSDRVRGPIKVWLDPGAGIVCRRGDGGVQPITALAGISLQHAA